MTGHRIVPITREEPVRQRRPRLIDNRHVRFVKRLSCVICGKRPVDPAHLRACNPLVGKRETGVSEKPSDHWLSPLCREHHEAQHAMGEFSFWSSYGIDNPFQLALALFAASIAEDEERAEQIVSQHRLLALGSLRP